jgi:hypothetical protein
MEEFIEIIQDDEQFEDVIFQLENAVYDDIDVFYVDEYGNPVDPDDMDEYDLDDEAYYDFIYDEEDEFIVENFDIFSPDFLDIFAAQILEQSGFLDTDEPAAKMERCIQFLKDNGFTLSDD